MVTKREYLIEKGLAKPGRGRFSRIANESIRQAEESGMVFTEEVKATSAKPAASKKSSPQTAEPAKANTARREEDKIYGKDNNGVVIALGDCANGHSVKSCGCANGPILPKWLGGGVGLLEKPA